MAATQSIEHQVALKLILNDMAFVRRYIDGIIARRKSEQAHVLSFGRMRYLSLYVYESHKALTIVAPEVAALLTVENADVIERSRHTVKLFDDSDPQIGGALGVTDQFDTIADAHRDYFLDNTWFPPAKVLETDLAMYRYRSRLISTTAMMVFHLGLPPELIKDHGAMGLALRSLSEGLANSALAASRDRWASDGSSARPDVSRRLAPRSRCRFSRSSAVTGTRPGRVPTAWTGLTARLPGCPAGR